MQRKKLEKKIPDQPANVVPVELRPQQILADRKFRSIEGKPFSAQKEEAQ
jgi:NADH dehydrogenase (ubiquinone) 1 alpha subcomplex subunit 8